jgi:hypothetical protein
VLLLHPMRPPTVTAAGRLTAAALCQVVAALQPPDAVLVDESLTSGNAYWEASKVFWDSQHELPVQMAAKWQQQACK